MDLLKRPRRLRSSPVLRAMLRETALSPHDFILPLFVSEKITSPAPVASMPGVFQLTEKALVEEAAGAHADGVPAVLLFGIPAHKDEQASQAHAAHGVVQRSVRALKAAVPGLLVITDVCLCEFMSHGHCGVTTFHGEHAHVDNDATVALLAQTAVSHAEAGADIIGALRRALDAAGFTDTPLLSYAAKFASAFYGPFRDAAESAPACGDRRTYQMDPANALEALREVALDIEEGADLVMVKPGLPYLDLVWRIKEKFGLPTAAYHVSGEYAMLKAAAQLGWLDEKACVLEQMLAFKRAGADLILTYYARQLARWLREG